jgi:hypothetical protein
MASLSAKATTLGLVWGKSVPGGEGWRKIEMKPALPADPRARESETLSCPSLGKVDQGRTHQRMRTSLTPSLLGEKPGSRAGFENLGLSRAPADVSRIRAE